MGGEGWEPWAAVGTCLQHSCCTERHHKLSCWLELYLHYYFVCPSSSFHTSGSCCTVVPGSAARLGLCSNVVPSKRSCRGGGQWEMYFLSSHVPPSWVCSGCSNANATEGEMRGEIYPGKCFLWKGSVLHQITKAELHGSYWFTLFYPSFVF